ncbi:putative death-receptor fusion protein-domain-containing protein [Phycomyces blakesleeanus]
MGISEKTKNGQKPVKLPKSIFVEWNAILNDFSQKYPNTLYIPAVASIKKLISKADEPWDKQAACLRESAKALNIAAAKKQLELHDIEQIKCILEPVASSGYFAAAENLSRRQFVPLLEAAVKHTENTTFEYFYTKYITYDYDESALSDFSLAQKALTIYATTDFDLGKRTVLNTFEKTMRFLVSGLVSAQQQLINPANDRVSTSKLAPQTLSADQLMNDLQYLSKTVLALVSRYGATSLFDFAKTLKLGPIETTEDTQIMSTLISILLDMCTRTNIYTKDCSQVAGMILGSIINLAQDPSFGRDWAIGWFFSADNEKLEVSEHVFKMFGVSPSNDLIGSSGWLKRDAPMLSVVRGLVSTVRKDILLLKCPAGFSLTKPLERNPSRNLHEIVFFSILSFCSKADLESQLKVVAFDALAMWLLETKNYITSCGNDAIVMDMISGVLTPQNVDIIIRYVWDHWDDPVDALNSKVRTIFELTLGIMETRASFYNKKSEYDEFLSVLLNNLLIMDWHRKVKYALLNILVPKVGTDAFFQAEPEIIWKCFRAMDSLVLPPQITSLVLSLLYQRIEETIPGYSPFKGQNVTLKEKDAETKTAIDNWIKVWAVPVLKCLTSDSEILRRNASGFILQPLFKVSPQSFWYIIKILQDTDDKHWSELDPNFRLNAFIAVLKAGRSLDIVDGSAYSYDRASLENSKISVDTLKLAIYHLDNQIRIDALGLLCESRKASSTVTNIELDMVKMFLPLNMNCTSPEFRQTLCAHITKFLTRLRGSMYAQYRTYRSRLVYVENNRGKRSEEDIKAVLAEAASMWKAIEDGKAFLYWLNEHNATSLYPGSSFQRVSTALRLIGVVIKIFGIEEIPIPDGFTVRPEFPFRVPTASPRNTKLLIDILTNPFDFNRNLAFDILEQFPSPLPGIESREDVQSLLWWGLSNVVSTRAGESDSGAMIFRLIFTKYITVLGFDLNPEQNVAPSKGSGDHDGSPAVVFTGKLMDMLDGQVAAAKNNLLQAAQYKPMHGTLLALQYVFRELEYHNPAVFSDINAWKKAHSRALTLIHTVCNTVMEVLSNPSPEGNIPASIQDMEENEDDMIIDNVDSEWSGPKYQIILSSCWRAVKEASSLLEVIISKAPIVTHHSKEGVITYDDLVESGSLLRSLLTTIRHRGAFSAVYPAYVSLNSRLLASPMTDIARLPSEWLKENLESLTSSNISITRRSAGLPLCILGVVSSEKPNKRDLLEMAMQRLFMLASVEAPSDADQKIDLPQVHAFNILRTIFMDSKLGTSVLKYASDGFSLSINGFSSPSWAIRNCSVMLFSTLLQRTFGTKKIKDEHSGLNKLTGREFFTRFPQLHPYLLKELDIAVKQLLADSMAASVHPGLYPILTLLSRMHPSVMDGTDEVISMAPFVPLVMSCASSSIFKTREMAARALVPLVPLVDLTKTVSELLTFNQRLSQNEIHGRLLQVQFLLRGHLYSNLPDEVLVEFFNVIPSSVAVAFELLFSNSVSCMTQALLLEIIGEFFFECTWMYADKDGKAVKEMQTISSEKLQVVRNEVFNYCSSTVHQSDVNAAEIGRYLVRQNMARVIMLGTLKKYQPNAQLINVLFLLEDRDYEVRLEALEQLQGYFEKHQDVSIIKDSGIELLQCKLVQMTNGNEENQNCFVLAAKLLMSLFSASPYPSNAGLHLGFTLKQYWDKLNEQFTLKKSTSVTESVLPLLGALLAQILKNFSTEEWAQKCLLTWCNYVTKYSHQDVTLTLREAVVESTHFTAKTVFAYANETNDAVDEMKATVQFVIAQLLQDDDIDIRNNTANIVSVALRLPAPVHPERAVELVNLHLSKNAKYSTHLQSTLTNVFEAEQSLDCVWKEELSETKVLFARESPNIYKEDLLDLQWVYIDIDILNSRYPSQFKNQSQYLCNGTFGKSVNQVIDLCKKLKNLSTFVMQNGPYGITSRPGIFIAAYRAIVATNSLYDHIDTLEGISDSFVGITKELNTLVNNVEQDAIHPLLWKWLRGEDGLSSKIKPLLKRLGSVTYSEMFLLAPDSRSYA